ncbi:MAG: type 4a pilus biogenesis protein PilO [Candidatus Moranbacteria bacterium]|nr:type 4a pilus biogenesis protein PilO [Candidatus Moranbacteria bacterium]
MLKAFLLPLAIIGGLLLIYMLAWPAYQDAREIAKKELNNVKKEYNKEVEIKNSIDKITQEYKQNQAYLEVVDEALPEEPQIKSFLVQLEALFLAEGIIYDSISITNKAQETRNLAARNPQVSATGAQPIVFSTQIVAPYENIKNFLYELENLSRLNNLTSLSLQFESRQGGGEEEEGGLIANTMSAEIELEAYIMEPLEAKTVKTQFEQAAKSARTASGSATNSATTTTK